MKTRNIFNWMMAAMLMSGSMVFTACSDDDDDDKAKTYTISFENQTLNSDGYWIGTTDGKGTSTDYGTNYSNTYSENGLTFNTTLSVSDYGTYWMGYAISNRTQTSFDMSSMTPDQFNSTIGKAHSGKNFCIVQTYGETIEVNGTQGAVVKELYYTNAAYTVNAYKNGDGMSEGGAFKSSDWLKCTITGKRTDGTTATVDAYLAQNGSYVTDWQRLDMSALGKVTELSFVFSGSRNNDWGLTTPAYMCIDDITIEVE